MIEFDASEDSPAHTLDTLAIGTRSFSKRGSALAGIANDSVVPELIRPTISALYKETIPGNRYLPCENLCLIRTVTQLTSSL